MKYQSQSPNYDRFPHVEVKGYELSAWEGWSSALDTISSHLSQSDGARQVLVIDTYHGVDLEELKSELIDQLGAKRVINSEYAKHPEPYIFNMLERHITDDRVFGVLASHKLKEFFNEKALSELKQEVEASQDGLTVVYGPGASLVHEGDIRIYADLARWEIQQRFRKGELSNWGVDNTEEDVLRRYKRAYFIEWRVFDRHKTSLLRNIDYLLDTNTPAEPKLVTGEALIAGIKQSTEQPFRVVPFFDPGVWGGQWMKEVCDLDKEAPNYAWCFDCVPEENSLY